jgi:hypothetical protein
MTGAPDRSVGDEADARPPAWRYWSGSVAVERVGLFAEG